MRSILTFGDSNTHGTVPVVKPAANRRYGADIRWPTVMAAALGPEWHLIEEGLPGRTTQFADPVMGAHMNGQEGLKIALASHGPLDVLTIMLGTNDLKTRFEPSAARIAAGVAGLLDIAMSDDMVARHPDMRILVICPPVVRDITPPRPDFTGAEALGPGISRALAELAQSREVAFFDAGTVIAPGDVDGVHFEAEAHKVLGAAIAKVVRGLP